MPEAPPGRPDSAPVSQAALRWYPAMAGCCSKASPPPAFPARSTAPPEAGEHQWTAHRPQAESPAPGSHRPWEPLYSHPESSAHCSPGPREKALHWKRSTAPPRHRSSRTTRAPEQQHTQGRTSSRSKVRGHTLSKGEDGCSHEVLRVHKALFSNPLLSRSNHHTVHATLPSSVAVSLRAPPVFRHRLSLRMTSDASPPTSIQADSTIR